METRKRIVEARLAPPDRPVPGAPPARRAPPAHRAPLARRAEPARKAPLALRVQRARKAPPALGVQRARRVPPVRLVRPGPAETRSPATRPTSRGSFQVKPWIWMSLAPIT